MDQDSKNIAVASYILPIGWIVAFVAKYICNCHTDFSTFHLRQSLGLNILILIIRPLFGLFGIFVINQLLNLLILIAIVYFAINAYNEKRLQIPFLGTIFNNLFSFIK